ncbi:MAG: response regulator [Pseudodesulfovibrio sp.]|nr:response regulator [Pseudodesulfovibrio sp.]
MTNNKKKQSPASYVALDETSQALLDSSIESVFVMDSKGYVLSANEAASKLFNLDSAGSLEQSNIYDLLPDDPTDSRKEKLDEAIKSGEPIRFEEEIQGRSLVHSIVPVVNPWGKVSRLAVNTLDLTQLRRTDEDLRREQQRQIFFMESLPGIVYHLYPDQTIRYANRYFRKYFGSPKGMRCKQALNCSGDNCAGCPPMDAMEMDRAVEWDWTDVKGRTFHLQCNPMTDSSGKRMIMVLGIDITARKRAEDALKKAHDRLEERVLQRTKELERANTELTSKSMRLVGAMKKADAATRAKSAFLANMSHEIRTPLNAVLGMSELALTVTTPDKKNTYLKKIMEAGNSLLTVINDILDFSKVEAHKLTLENIDFDVRKTLTTALDVPMLQAQSKGLTLTSRVDDNVPMALVGDPSRLGQILINLISNAVKFTETGGVDVVVSMKNGQTNPNKGDNVTIRFSITDSGIGIAPDKQQAIFQSFLQADDSITRKHGGTGLGLAICKLLVELMQGRLRLTSEEGKGSTFSFTVKQKVGDPDSILVQTVEVTDTTSMDLSKLKVLLADDNALNRELATTLLTEQGHEVVAVENGVQALEAVKTDLFDIVLMDVQMPIMDGVTATRAIRDPNSGALDPAIPIVAITAHALKGDRERFLEAGMNDYIPKPIKMNDFYKIIANTMDGRTPVEETPSREKLKKAPPGEPFDRATALEMIGGRKDLLTRMDAIFLRDVPEELRELTTFVSNQDWDNARRLAHSIKGSSRTVGAQRVGAISEQLEYLCKQKDAASAQKKFITLESEVIFALEYIKNDPHGEFKSTTSTQGAH